MASVAAQGARAAVAWARAAPPRCRAGLLCRSLHETAAQSAQSSEPQGQPPRQPQLVKRRKRRLDEVCLERHPEHSRNLIQSWIAQGKVLVNDQPVLKAGAQVSDAATVVINAVQPKYVCRAGLKLESALAHFGVEVAGKRALDSGLSTGGFTDCLLQNGAESVVGVDVGYGQVAERIRTHPRVRVMERTNLRALRLSDLGGPPLDLVTLDLSFISLLKVVDAVASVLRPGGELVALIKPQFEAGKEQVSTGGIVRDPEVHRQVIQRVVGGYQAAGFACQGWTPSPIKGATAGNTEFLAYFLFQQEGSSSGDSGSGGEQRLEEGQQQQQQQPAVQNQQQQVDGGGTIGEPLS